MASITFSAGQGQQHQQHNNTPAASLSLLEVSSSCCDDQASAANSMTTRARLSRRYLRSRPLRSLLDVITSFLLFALVAAASHDFDTSALSTDRPVTIDSPSSSLDEIIFSDVSHSIIPRAAAPATEDVIAVQSNIARQDDALRILQDTAAGDSASINIRAATPATSLDNNTPWTSNILPNATNNYEFPLTTILNSRTATHDTHDDYHQELRKRQTSTTTNAYITINTCLQPSFADNSSQADPPQLSIWISQSSQNTSPGPFSIQSARQIPLDSGYANITLSNLSPTSPIYIGISAPSANLSSGVWNYELAASIDQNYHSYISSLPGLFMSDSDPNAALLVTKNFSLAVPEVKNGSGAGMEEAGGGLVPMFSLFVQPTNVTTIRGLEKSYCGMSKTARFQGILPRGNPGGLAVRDDSGNGGGAGGLYATEDKLEESSADRPGIWRHLSGSVSSSDSMHDSEDALLSRQLPDILSGGIETSITAYGEQIFYVPSLNATSNYTAMLAIASDPNTPGGGGAVYNSTTFITKQMANCQIIYGLSFCSTVAYAVPANPSNFTSMSALAAAYDNSTAANYQFFNYSLQQIPCNTTATAQYSLVKTCDDCADAYKTWLCAVSIPRCADWTLSNASEAVYPAYSGEQNTDAAGNALNFLMPRNAAQAPIPATRDLIAPVTDQTLLNWVAFNTSRNSELITETIAPGPYMEVLPCEDLCHELVRSCPAALGFACPRTGRGLEWSYGTRRGTADGAVTCNRPGAVWGVSGGRRVQVWGWMIVVGVVGVVFVAL